MARSKRGGRTTDRVRLEPPRVTIGTSLATAAVTGLGLMFPRVVSALQRTPAAVDGEWWRLVSPILVNPEGSVQIATNFSALLILGAIVERRWGPRPWLIFYTVGGIVGQIAGLAWRPFGAGSSVAVCGLLGAVSLSLLRIANKRARFGASIILGGAFLLTWMHDLHGPPILAATCLAALWPRQE